ncbi:MAG: right-handed parallel beta-helix repeat-containing protein [Acidimicrobiales bacterium]
MTLKSACTTTESIVVPSGYTFNGDHFTITAEDPGTKIFDGAVVSADGGKTTIDDLTIDGDFTNSNPKCKYDLAGVSMYDVKAATVEDVTIENLNRGPDDTCGGGDGIDVINGKLKQFSTVLEGDTISGVEGIGISLYGDVSAEIANNSVTGYADSQGVDSCYGISVNADNAGLTIENNQVTEDCMAPSTGCNGLSLYTSSGTSTITDNTIDGSCDSSEYSTNGILLWESSGLDVSGNSTAFSGASSNGIGIWDEGFFGPANDNDVENNTVEDSPFGVTVIAEYVSDATTAEPTANSNDVEGNDVDDPASGTYGVEVFQCSGEAVTCNADTNAVENNTISCYTTPVEDEGTDTAVSGNTIGGCPPGLPSRYSRVSLRVRVPKAAPKI